MSELPGDLLYTNDHEWLRREGDGSVTIGITDHAQRRWATSFTSNCPKSGRMSRLAAKWPLSNR